jgi:acetolactate synthase-1/2/3 large subunit
VKISGGGTVVKSLVWHKVETVYGLPGSHILEIYDWLRAEKRINNVLTMHEINAAFMADAHGRLTGQPGVCIVTAGPGATNAVTGIAQAYAEASPVVLITGGPNGREKIRHDHTVDDLDFLLKIYRPLTKWSVRIERLKDIPSILDKAFNVATSGRPGPVHLEIPTSVLLSSGYMSEFGVDTKTVAPDITSSVKRVTEILQSAADPIIAVGKGVQREFCSEEVTRLSEVLCAPILTLPSSISAVPYDFPLYLGYDLAGDGSRWMVHPSINSLIKEADVILSLGFDVEERLFYFRENKGTLIQVHRDPSTTGDDEAACSRESVVDVEASVKEFVKLLETEVKERHIRPKVVEKRISDIKKKIREDIAASIEWGAKPIHPGEISTELRRILDDDAIVTLDVGDTSEWAKVCCRARTSNTILASGRYCSMGFALPAAIAAKINFPDKQVVAVTGDGGFLMSYMDFPTLVKYKLGIIVIVGNNQRYGMIWNMQRAKYRGRTFATEIQVPDLAEYARTFGASGFKVKDPKDLKNTLEEAINTKGPVLVDVDTAYNVLSYMPTKVARYLRNVKYLRTLFGN